MTQSYEEKIKILEELISLYANKYKGFKFSLCFYIEPFYRLTVESTIEKYKKVDQLININYTRSYLFDFFVKNTVDLLIKGGE